MDDYDQHDMIELAWDADLELWRGTAAEPWRPVAAAAGPAGPAGVDTIIEGDLQVRQCRLSGRIESVDVPRELDEEQRDVLRMLTVGEDAARFRRRTATPIRVRFRRPRERSALSNWARLTGDDARLDTGSTEWRYLLIDQLSTALLLHRIAPTFMDRDRVADLCDQASLNADRLELSAPIPPAIRAWLRTWVTRTVDIISSLTPPPRPETLPVDRLLLGLRRLGGTLTATCDNLGTANNPGAGGGYLGSSAAVASLRGPDRPPHPAAEWHWLRFADAAHDMPSAAEALLIIRDGVVQLDEVTAHRMDLTAGTGTVDMAAGPHACRVVFPAVRTSRQSHSRWIVLFDSSLTVTGVGPLRVDHSRGTSMAIGRILIDGNPDRLVLTTHPLLPDQLTGSVSLNRLLDEARNLADDRALGIAPDGDGRWQQVALDWLRLGSLTRGAWAHALARAPLPSIAFADPSRRDAAEETLGRYVDLGAVPADGTPTSGPVVPAWVAVSRVAHRSGGSPQD